MPGNVFLVSWHFDEPGGIPDGEIRPQYILHSIENFRVRNHAIDPAHESVGMAINGTVLVGRKNAELFTVISVEVIKVPTKLRHFR
jgi:hypothetical protein